MLEIALRWLPSSPRYRIVGTLGLVWTDLEGADFTASSLKPGNLSIKLELARLRLADGDVSSARSEIEQILAENPQIIEFAVVGRPDQRWGEVPVAVVVPRSPGSLSREDVLTPLAGRLARYKHPKDVLFVEALPRNAMGKITKADVREMVAREAGAASGAGNRDRRV